MLPRNEDFINVRSRGQYVGGERDFQSILGAPDYAPVMERYQQRTICKVQGIWLRAAVARIGVESWTVVARVGKEFTQTLCEGNVCDQKPLQRWNTPKTTGENCRVVSMASTETTCINCKIISSSNMEMAGFPCLCLSSNYLPGGQILKIEHNHKIRDNTSSPVRQYITNQR